MHALLMNEGYVLTLATDFKIGPIVYPERDTEIKKKKIIYSN